MPKEQKNATTQCVQRSQNSYLAAIIVVVADGTTNTRILLIIGRAGN
jgi:hypothetical protein